MKKMKKGRQYLGSRDLDSTIGEIHYITEENYPAAHAAMRDILFLYHEIASTSDGGARNAHIVPGLATGTFDPILYVRCEEDCSESGTYGCDTQLLQEGSAIAILAILEDLVSEEQTRLGFKEAVQELLALGGLDHLPVAKTAIQSYLSHQPGDVAVIARACQHYLTSYFARMLGAQ